MRSPHGPSLRYRSELTESARIEPDELVIPRLQLRLVSSRVRETVLHNLMERAASDIFEYHGGAIRKSFCKAIKGNIDTLEDEKEEGGGKRGGRV